MNKKDKKEFKMEKVDLEFSKVIDDIAFSRIQNNLVPKPIKKEDISTREITRLMLKAPSFSNLKKELETFPRKEDLDNE